MFASLSVRDVSDRHAPGPEYQIDGDSGTVREDDQAVQRFLLSELRVSGDGSHL